VINRFSKYQIAIGIAIFFHAIGLVGMLFTDNDFFVHSTPFNLLLSFFLLIWTHPEKNKSFYFFIGIVFIVGFLSEVVGVNTGLLFGDYHYSKILGIQLFQVPILIAVNWFIIIYCSGIGTHVLLNKVIHRVAKDYNEPSLKLKAMSVIFDGASLAVLFDWLMEPVAIKLGFWTWDGDGSVPFYNYFCWLLISILLLTVFNFFNFRKENKFAVNLLLIQALFFLILRTFLK
jgi:putative membrane protein